MGPVLHIGSQSKQVLIGAEVINVRRCAALGEVVVAYTQERSVACMVVFITDPDRSPVASPLIGSRLPRSAPGCPCRGTPAHLDSGRRI